jgi:hypothetical protein
VTTVTVNGDHATATVTGGTQRAELTETDAGWLISGGLNF